MVSSFLKPRPRVRLDSQVDGGPYYPGDQVEVRVVFSSQDHLRIAEGWVDLRCIETYWGSVERVPPANSLLFTPRVSGFLSRESQSFLVDWQAAPISPPRTFTVRLPIPTGAPPTVRGEIASIKWVVRVSLDIPRHRDVYREIEIIVVSRPVESGSEGQGTGPMLEDSTEEIYRQCTIGVATTSPEARAGAAVSGILKVSAKQDARFSVAKLRLVRREQAGTRKKQVVVDEVVLQERVSLPAGVVQEWPFTLVVPDGLMPSASTYMAVPGWVTMSQVAWSLEAVLPTGILSRFRVEKPLRVYTG